MLEESDIELPDLLTDLQDKTQLTRRSLVRILTESERLDDFKRNPQQFIEHRRAKRSTAPSGSRSWTASSISESANEHYYAQELFEQEELTGYLKNMLAVRTIGLRARRLRLGTQSEPSPRHWKRTRR